MEQIQLLVSGVVQGVGFRYATRNEARRLGLGGWVRNTADGKVEILAQGMTSALQEFERWCGKGPANADVAAVQVVAREPIGTASFPSFEIERG